LINLSSFGLKNGFLKNRFGPFSKNVAYETDQFDKDKNGQNSYTERFIERKHKQRKDKR